MNPFFLFFIGLPALEIFLLIKIGGQVGALNTLALIFLTAIIGIYFAKLQGIQTLKSGMVNLYQNKVPLYEMISGASIALAALLLIVPGFFTDLIGFLLLIPFTRKIIFNLSFKKKPIRDIGKQDETIDGEMTISIFPNPTSNTINVVFDKELELSLFNMLGQQVIKTSNKNIDISNFEKGTYILVVENIETGNFTNFKIIKE